MELAFGSSLWHADQVVRVTPTPLGKLLARHAEASVTDALADTRVVLVTGARQSGKSTLVALAAKGRNAEWRNLDTATIRRAAIADPVAHRPGRLSRGTGPDEPPSPRALLRLLPGRSRRS